MSTSIQHNDKNIGNSIAVVTITHPFHPDCGKTFEYLGEANEKVRCLDENGSIRLIPIKQTDQHIDAIGGLTTGGGLVASVDELLAVKRLVDGLLCGGEV